MKRTVALVSMAAALAAATLVYGAATTKSGNCSDCPVPDCPFCPHAK